MRDIATTGHTTVFTDDDPDAGGAHHRYVVLGGDSTLGKPLASINLQHGPRKVAGINGLQHIDLLRIIEHRLVCFQAGSFACDENAACLSAVRDAIAADEARTASRKKAGVEGRNAME